MVTSFRISFQHVRVSTYVLVGYYESLKSIKCFSYSNMRRNYIIETSYTLTSKKSRGILLSLFSCLTYFGYVYEIKKKKRRKIKRKKKKKRKWQRRDWYLQFWARPSRGPAVFRGPLSLSTKMLPSKSNYEIFIGLS